MIMQQQTTEELSNLLIQSVEAKDEKTILKILEQDDEKIIREIINNVPVHHVRKLVIELRNILSHELTSNHLRWLQQILASKFTVISSMADGRSILLPLINLLDDRSSPAYYVKMQALKGKVDLLKQLKEARRTDTAETVVRIPVEREPPSHMEVESETDSEADFDDDDDDEDDLDELDEAEDIEGGDEADEAGLPEDVDEADGSEVDDRD